jgi:glycosyltransferase involved in cell wall biosynthesis
MRRYLPRCSAVIANSASVATDVRSILGGPPAIQVVHNTVDLDAFAPDGARLDLDALAGLPGPADGTVRVGLVATFGRWKGHDVFLQALSLVPAATAVRGYIVGAPVYDTTGSQTTRAELEARVRALGLAGRVGFTGFVESGAAMRSLDVVVHASSEPEPFGLVVAEAMACGRPVITTGHGGVAEIIDDGQDAIVAPAGDAAALAAAIRGLVEDPAGREALGTRARTSAVARFARERMAANLVRIYESVATPVLEARSA